MLDLAAGDKDEVRLCAGSVRPSTVDFVALVTENQRVHFSLPQKLVFQRSSGAFKGTVIPKNILIYASGVCGFGSMLEHKEYKYKL